MKYTFLIVLLHVAQYGCQSNNNPTHNLDSNIFPSNPDNITSNQNSIEDCQKPSFANYTIGKKRFISVDSDTFEEYLKTVDLTVFDGLFNKKEFLNWVPSEEMKNDIPCYLSGYDRQNRPIWVFEYGKTDFNKYALGGREKQALFIKYCRYNIFEIFKSMAFKSTKENPVFQYQAINDFEGYAPLDVLNPTVLRFRLKVASLFRHWFRKHISKIVLLNVNQIAEIILNGLRSTFARNVKKLEVYGTNKEFWLKQLLKSFPKDQIPEKYGGCKGFLPTYVV